MSTQRRLPETAADFCVFIGDRQRDFGELGVQLTKQQAEQLRLIIQDLAKNGRSTELDRRAREFLVAYRDLEADQGHAVLSQEERTRLTRILFEENPRPKISLSTRRLRRHVDRRVLIAAIAVIVCVGGFVGYDFFENPGSSPPPAGNAQQHPPAQEVPPANSDLQNFKQGYGPFNEVTPSDQQPQTGQPALLFLDQGGGYFVSTKWTVSPSASGWGPDVSGHVSNINVKGTYADITDSDGTPYVVGVNQPLVFWSDPNTVVYIDSIGHPYAMSMMQATVVRQPLNK